MSTTCTTIAKDTHQPTQQEKGNPTAQDKSSALHVNQKCTADDVAKASYTHHPCRQRMVLDGHPVKATRHALASVYSLLPRGKSEKKSGLQPEKIETRKENTSCCLTRVKAKPPRDGPLLFTAQVG